MPRAEDIAWKFVIRLEGRKWRCPYCPIESSGSVTRVKSHLLKQANGGISSCTGVPEHIRMLMELLHDNQVRNKEDIAWKFVDRVEDSKWCCYYCSREFFGDLTGVKGHLLGVLNEGISICTGVPEHVRTLMWSLLDDCEQMVLELMMPDSGVNSDQQLQAERQSHESSAMPLSAQISHGWNILMQPASVPPQHRSVRHQSIDHEIRDTQHNATIPLENRDTTRQPDLHDSPPENLVESGDAIANTPEEIQTNEEHNPTMGSSLRNDLSNDVDHTNRLQDWSQQCIVEGVPLLSNTCPTNTVQHLRPLHPRCDKEDGNDTRLFPLPTPMDIEPSIALLHSSNSHNFEVTIDDSQVLEAATNTTGPSSSQDVNRGSPIVDVWNNYATDKEMKNLKRKVGELYVKEADTKEQMEIESAASSVWKKPRILVEGWLKETERARNNFQIIGQAHAETLPTKEQVETLTSEVEELIEKTLPQPLLIEERDAKGDKLLERKLTGIAIHRNIKLIWDHLTKNHGCKLGIYGMGGVGKTTIMKHIYNTLLEDATFDGVAFITMSQGFSNSKLQSAIWKALKLGDMEDELEEKRAAKLFKHLERKKNCVLILDNVWNHFDLKEMGIPVGADGIKLVLTTRSIDVCHQMLCQEKIEIKPLSQEEAKNLFLEELGSEVVPDSKIKALMKSIVGECAGLPIGVITMARSMRGVTDEFEWRDSLVKLKESGKGQPEMVEKVLMNLKFSYDRLSNPDVQQCFLSCALYPEGEFIDKCELVEFFIDQGLIGGLNTRKEQYDRGLTTLKKLRNACLLEDHESTMKMHDLIRDMALNIMSATSIVQAGKQLMRIPSEEHWTDALEKVSLMKNDIRAFPLNMSPNCPKLSTLLLNGCWSGNVVVPDSFFKNLLGLKVLNLSGCHLTKLPNSISDLVNLRALLLQRCRKLRRIPCLEKLTSLRKLDVSGCHMLEAPEGLGRLVNLEYLDLGSTCMGRLPKGTLGGLLNLQYLKVGAVDGEDITKLKALETLEWSFSMDVDDFNKCVRDDFNECVRAIEQINPFYYDLYVDKGMLSWDVEVKNDAPCRNGERKVAIFGASHAIVSMGGECTGNFTLTPRDVQIMIATGCDSVTNLSGMGPLERLEKLEIEDWENLRVLCGGHDSAVPTPTPLLFPSLKVLNIESCPKLKYLFGHGSTFELPHLREIKIRDCEEMVGLIAAVTSPPHLLLAFPSLKVIDVEGCDKMKRVVELEWMLHFPHLKSITVSYCKNMEEIIGGPPPNLPVKGISLESLEVERCHNMRKLFSLEWLLHFQNLQNIYVGMCNGMVEMISGAGQGQEASIISLSKLKVLYLRSLPQLKSICRVPISCNSMEELGVYQCPELKGIPLQLQLRETKELPHIWVEDEEKWKTLQWDHPNAEATLQPYLRKGEHANHQFWKETDWEFSLWCDWQSPNPIELDANGKNLL